MRRAILAAIGVGFLWLSFSAEARAELAADKVANMCQEAFYGDRSISPDAKLHAEAFFGRLLFIGKRNGLNPDQNERLSDMCHIYTRGGLDFAKYMETPSKDQSKVAAGGK